MKNLKLFKTPWWLKFVFPKRVWQIPNTNNKIYLTFDDGPIPEVTPWVVEQLKKYNAKATFFCIGENILKNPDVFTLIKNEEHDIANHTYNHLNGKLTSNEDYIKNVIKFESIYPFGLGLFRPPYGKLTSKQAKILQKKGYKIIMWHVLSYDWDTSVSKEICLQKTLKNIKPGSIVVFHDSLKAQEKLRFVLPKVLIYIQKNGWQCEGLNTAIIKNCG